jgi:ATP-dependent Lon protease
VRAIALDRRRSVRVGKHNLARYAGPPRFRFGEAERADLVGAATGLAWTEVGGELLPIETVVVPGEGRITSTGRLGDVMRESIQAADIFVKARAERLGIDAARLQTQDVHVHLPEGAVPKDGPSAGIALVTAIVSSLTGIPVRRDVAMTGEITLRGRVLPIGGLKEKLLAAARGGLDTVLIPHDNAGELAEIPAGIRRGLTIVPVAKVTDVLERALVRPPLAHAPSPEGPAEPPDRVPPPREPTDVVTH